VIILTNHIFFALAILRVLIVVWVLLVLLPENVRGVADDNSYLLSEK